MVLLICVRDTTGASIERGCEARLLNSGTCSTGAGNHYVA
jgi:hypothetical protein